MLPITIYTGTAKQDELSKTLSTSPKFKKLPFLVLWHKAKYIIRNYKAIRVWHLLFIHPITSKAYPGIRNRCYSPSPFRNAIRVQDSNEAKFKSSADSRKKDPKTCCPGIMPYINSQRQKPIAHQCPCHSFSRRQPKRNLYTITKGSRKPTAINARSRIQQARRLILILKQRLAFTVIWRAREITAFPTGFPRSDAQPIFLTTHAS